MTINQNLIIPTFQTYTGKPGIPVATLVALMNGETLDMPIDQQLIIPTYPTLWGGPGETIEDIVALANGGGGGGSFNKADFFTYSQLMQSAYRGDHLWSLGEESGDAIDSFGSVDGTLVGGVTQGAAGLLDDVDGTLSYDFDGTDGYVSLGTTALSATRTIGTFQAWFNQDDTAGTQRIFTQTNLSGGTILVTFGTFNGTLIINIRRNTASNQYQIRTPVLLTAGVTYHLGVVQRADGAGFQVFLNGVLLDSGTFTVDIDGTGTINDWFAAAGTGANLPAIGSRRVITPDGFFNGRIAQVSIHGNPFTDEEMIAAYNTGIGQGPKKVLA